MKRSTQRKVWQVVTIVAGYVIGWFFGRLSMKVFDKVVPAE